MFFDFLKALFTRPDRSEKTVRGVKYRAAFPAFTEFVTNARPRYCYGCQAGKAGAQPTPAGEVMVQHDGDDGVDVYCIECATSLGFIRTTA